PLGVATSGDPASEIQPTPTFTTGPMGAPAGDKRWKEMFDPLLLHATPQELFPHATAAAVAALNGTVGLGMGVSDVSTRMNFATRLLPSRKLMPYSAPENAMRGQSRSTPSDGVMETGPTMRAPVASVLSILSASWKGDCDTTSSSTIE